MNNTYPKLAEQGSHDIQAPLDVLLENVNVIILEGDPFDIYFVGGQVEKILGWPKEMWFSHPDGPVGFWSEKLHPDDMGKIEICRQAIERGEDHTFEYRMIAKDGRAIWFYDSVMVETRDGKPVKTRSVMFDITKHKRAEQATQEKQSQLDDLLSNVNAIILEGDPYEFYYVGGQVEKILGWPIEMWFSHPDGPGGFWLEKLHPDDVDKPKICRQAIERGEEHTFEYRMIAKDGTYVWFFDSVMVETRDGKPVKTRSVMIDITARKLMEDALRESEIKSRALLEGSPVCIKIISLDSRLLYMSSAGIRQLKIADIKPFYGKIYPPEFYPEEMRKPLVEHLERAKTGKTCNVGCQVLDTAGGVVWYSTTFVPARDSEGNIEYIIASSVDITKHKKLEQQARQHMEALSHASRVSTMAEMTTGIAHEINQPLAAIATYSGTAKMIVEQLTHCPDELREAIGNLEDQVVRAGDIVRRLRNFMKKTDPDHRPVDLKKLIQEVAKFVEPDIHQANTNLTLKIDETPAIVMIDEIQIQQVLVNLIRNALDATGEKPSNQRKVTVSNRILQDGVVEVAVSDAGKGIPEDELDQVFDAFFTTKKDGLGMGLAISRSLIEMHEGKLWVKLNTGPGVTFGFTLPLKGKK